MTTPRDTRTEASPGQGQPLVRPPATSPARLGLMIALLMAIATGCALCERGEAPPGAAATVELAQLVPNDVDAAFFTADWKNLRDGAAILQRQFGTQMPIAQSLDQLKQRFGVDLRDIPGLKAKGVRTGGGLAVTYTKDNVVLLIPIEAEKVFEDFALALGKERLGAADQPITKQIDGHTLKFLVKKPADGQAPATIITPDALVLAWTIRDGTAIVFPGKDLAQNTADAEISLTRHLKLKPEASLSKLPDFDGLQKELSASHPIFGFVNLPASLAARAGSLGEFTHSKAQADEMKTISAEVGWVGVGLKIEDAGLNLHVQVLARGNVKKRIDEGTEALGASAALAPTLDGAPALALKTSFHPQKGIAELRKLLGDDAVMLDESLALLKRQFQVDVEAQVLPALDGNLVWAVYEAPPTLLQRPDLSMLMTTSRTTFSLGLRDRGAIIKAFDSVAQGASAFVKRSEQGGVVLYAFQGDAPLATLAVGDKVALVASAKISAEDAVRLASAKGKGPQGALAHPQVKAVADNNRATGILLDPAQLQKIVGIEQAASPFAGLDRVLISAMPEPRGAVLDLTVGFVPIPKEKAAPQ